jgi:hypothetical protein
MLVITGMGRSGTSVLAALCKQLGYDPGGDYVEGINAGLEDPAVVAVNEDVFRPAPAGGPLAGRVRAVRRVVVKDPRFILEAGRPLRVWWEHRQDLRVVLTGRDPEEVVRSRQAHPHWFGQVHDGEAGVLRDDVAAAAGLMTDLGIPFRRLHFPDFLGEPAAVFEALRFGGLSFSDWRAKRHWRKLVDPAKVRHSPGWSAAAPGVGETLAGASG